LNRTTRIAIVCVVGAVLLALALRGVDPARVRALVAGVNPGLVAAALAVYVSAYVLRSLRWRLILRPVERVRVSESFFMLMAGYFVNYIVPVRAGEVAKAFFLKRLKGVPIATSLPTIYVDKLFELMSVVLVLVLVPVLSLSLTGYLATLVYSVLAVFVLALALLLFALANGRGTARALSLATAWLPAKTHARLSHWFALLVEGMGVARANVRSLGALVALTACAVVLDATYFALMFRAFSLDISFAQVLFGYTLLSVSYILPTPPAQIGHNEFLMVVIFADGFGFGRTEVTALMLLAHALTGILIAALGLWSFGAMSIRVTESFRHPAKEERPS
jgi:glycosyltransferase 2 family protein